MKDYMKFTCTECGITDKGEVLSKVGQVSEARIPKDWILRYKIPGNGGQLGEPICFKCSNQ